MYGKPTFSGLHKMFKILKENNTNGPIEITNRNYCLLLLITSQTNWETINDHAWIPPNDPGTPPILAAVTLKVNMKNTTQIHQKKVKQ